MNYKQHYDRLIKTRKLLGRKRKEGIYYEKHYILPKSCGGTNDENNLVFLTAKEHYIAHLLLIHCYDGDMKTKMKYAFAMMLRSNKYHERLYSASQYQRIREKIGLARLGNKMSEETKLKISISEKGRIFSEEHKNKISKANSNRILSKETKEKISLTKRNNKRVCTQEEKDNLSKIFKGRKMPIEAVLRVAEKNKGKKRSEESKQKMRDAKLGRKLSDETKEKMKQSRINYIKSLS